MTVINSDRSTNIGNNRTIKTKAITLSTILFLIYLFILPTFGVAIDYQESVIFFGLPFLFYLNLVSEKHSKKLRLTHLNILLQSSLILLFLVSTLLSKNIGVSYYYFWNFIVILELVNLINLCSPPLVFINNWAVVISTLFSTILLLSKFGIITLPIKTLGDNYILQIWGHSYFGNFLLIPIAITIFQINSKNIRSKIALLALFLVTLVLSQSRSGALGAAIAVFLLKPLNPLQKTTKRITLASLLFGLILLIIFSFTSFATYKSANGSRPQYWHEATKGILQSPFFGNGPNTFNVVNRQQRKPTDLITNTTHNIVLEYLTNNGLIFTAIFLLYVLYGLKHQKTNNPLFYSLGAGIFVSSLFDSFFCFPGFLVLLLFFATYHHPKYFITLPRHGRMSANFIQVIAVASFIFFISKTSSDFAFFTSNYQLSLKLDPFNLNPRLQLHDEKTIADSVKLYANEELLYLSLVSDETVVDKKDYYLRLFEINPLVNPTYYQMAGYYYLNQRDFSNLENTINLFSHNFSASTNLTDTLPLAKLSYHLSLFYWQEKNYDNAIKYAKIAIKLASGWSHFHIELANMYWYLDRKPQAVSQLQTECPKSPPSSKACLEYLRSHQTRFDIPGNPDLIISIDSIHFP